MISPKEAALISSYKVESSLVSISLDPTETFLVAGGREVLRLFSVENTCLKEVRNLRSGRKRGLKYSINDICWHKQRNFQNLILSGSTDGSIVLWDLAVDTSTVLFSTSGKNLFPFKPVSSGKKMVEPHFVSGHDRAINKVDWHVSTPQNFLSCSQDGCVKLWDLREFGRDSKPISSFIYNKDDPVRDALFSPHNSYWIGGGYESGNFVLWDLRRTDKYILNIRAHAGLLFSLSWHPTVSSVVATGGRDKMIRVWNLLDEFVDGSYNPISTDLQDSDVYEKTLAKVPADGTISGYQELFSLSAIAAISKVSWRPEDKTKIASSSAVLDTKISVWDVSFPYLPVISLRGHRDTVTCLLWNSNGQFLFSCSRNGAIFIQQVDKGYRPYSRLRNSVFSISVDHSIALARNASRHEKCYKQKLESSHSLFIWRRPRSRLLQLKLSGEEFGFHLGGGLGLEMNVVRDVSKLVTPLLADAENLSLYQWQAQFCEKLSTYYRNNGDFYLEFVWNSLFQIFQQLFHLSLSSTRHHFAWNRIQSLATGILVKWWQYFSDAGDVQTCTFFILGFGSYLNTEQCISHEIEYSTICVYLDILRRMELHILATEIQASAPFPEISQMNAFQSTVHDARTNDFPSCSVCHRRIKHTYSWCQGCGHGSHTFCLLEWFTGKPLQQMRKTTNEIVTIRELCPVSFCQHRCVLSRNHDK
eukprot:jgi/Galph1/1126/GphlegSOOS_G5832.1